MPKITSRFAFVLISVVFVGGCGDSKPPESEAYQVGVDMGIADKCGARDRSGMPMPSAYDDSMEKGELEAAFSAGYNAGQSSDYPCKR